MKFLMFEGKRLRVWSRRELEPSKEVADAGGLPAVAADGSTMLRLESSCHPVLNMQNSPADLRVEFHSGDGILVVRCRVCGKPVFAFEVA
jgi:hypothetical protein